MIGAIHALPNLEALHILSNSGNNTDSLVTYDLD
jgi:hypothetical protein